jgi:WD40 repeat protein
LGDAIVIGFGGDESSAKCGTFLILNEIDLSIAHEARDTVYAITVALYSPDGETLAIGAADGSIYLYGVVDDYELVGRCVQNTTPVKFMDFSRDGEWLRSNSESKDLLFFNSDDRSYQSVPASMREVQWSSDTCIYTWHVKSLHEYKFYNEMVTCIHTPTASAPFLACGTSTGYLRLHAFPCNLDFNKKQKQNPSLSSECHRFPAHVDAVACIRFSFDQDRLLSLGQKDQCVIQWRRVSYPLDNARESESSTSLSQPKLEEGSSTSLVGFRKGPLGRFDSKLADLLDGDELVNEIMTEEDLSRDFIPDDNAVPDGLLNGVPVEEVLNPNTNKRTGKLRPKKGSNPETDDSTNIKKQLPSSPEMDIWLEKIVAPSNPPAVQKSIPDMSLRLESVYGYKCRNINNCIAYNKMDDIAYVGATVGIVMRRGNRSQIFFQVLFDVC